MAAKQVAIACQGGGIHGAFTSGVLEAILDHQDAMQEKSPKSKEDTFEICGLSGTSAGALNAFLVWYAMMLHDGKPNRFREAREALDRLWDLFSAQRLGERGINLMGQCLFSLGRFGLGVKHPMPPYLHRWLMQALPTWSAIETAMSRHPLFPHLDFDLGEVRPTFYDFQALLKACAPQFKSVRAEEDEIARVKRKPRLLVGAVDILSGRFEAFDSFADKGKRKRISLDAIEASGTLPEIHRSQRIDDMPGENNGDSLYWDGLFSQNPPVREFLAGELHADAKPREIWVIRINPQAIPKEPVFLSSIEDRRNELAGNLSLHQELEFIGQVNDWIRDKIITNKRYQRIDVYVITMFEQRSHQLKVDSKFDRDPGFIRELRAEGKLRGERFLQLWTAGEPCELRQWWPEDENRPKRRTAIPQKYEADRKQLFAQGAVTHATDGSGRTGEPRDRHGCTAHNG